MKRSNTIQRITQNFQQRIALPAITLLFIFSISAVSTAQDLAKFKYCASAEGVECIPFSAEKTAAESAENSKKSAESEAKTKFGVKALTDNLASAKKKLADEQKILVAAEKALVDAKKYHPAVIATEEKAVKASQDKIEDLEAAVEDVYTEIEYGVNHWKQLAIARGKVRIAFDNAIDELNEALNDPEDYIGKKPTDAEDLKKWNADLVLLKGYINEIKSNIEAEKKGHLEQEEGANNAATNLSNL
jgi:CCR4-NOT transcriptional regulation complex NOT5 subunit